jgi:CubicO group peptidase (beta-lactamase class C family)
MSSLRPTGRTSRPRPFLACLLTVLLTTTAYAPVLAQETFPEATPESQGMSSEALAELVDVVQGYIDREMAVGAELAVIKNRHVVLHEAFGWQDREAEVPMEPDTLFNIRSMTKPITGAAAQVLVDEGLLALDDRASRYLPGFESDQSREITVEQLLTHRSGLPLTILESTEDYESLEAMANAIGEVGPEFEPGSKFWYSDAGADTLGAVIEQVSGSVLETFVNERLLQPLGMADTYYLDGSDEPSQDRIASLYVGRIGDWTRFWGPDEEPFYPYAWGSQSLYATPLDYARFLAMWLDEGTVEGNPILSPEAIARTLTPTAAMGSLGSDAPYLTLYPDLTAYHGQMALLHIDGEPLNGDPSPGAAPVVIGYSGSDGTIAWAWPDRDLIILYFTQSRGGSTVIRLEAEIQRLLLDPTDDAEMEVPEAYAHLLGTYTANFGQFRNEPFEVLWRDGALVLDIPSQIIFAFDQTDVEGRWDLRGAPGTAVSFVQDGADDVTHLRIHRGTDVIDLPKGAPEPGVEPILQPEEAEPYLGWYVEDGSERQVEVVLQDGQLALRIPESPEPLELYPPDDDGVWLLRMNPAVEISFAESDGAIGSYVARGPGGEATFTRLDQPAE